MKPKQRTLKGYVKLFLSGSLMGASDIIPGVSGGTMAFILGIYEELIDSIRQVNKSFFIKFFKLKVKELIETFPWRFLLVLGLGILTAIFTLAHTLEWLLKTYPEQVWSFFFGLVLASVFTVSHRIKKWNYSVVVFLLVGAISAYQIVWMTPTTTPDTPLILIGSGMLAITAMILPGISGSFILLILGKYQTILEAVTNRDFVIIAYVGIGAVIGLLTIAQVLGYLFKKYHDATVAVLAGFMLGSLRKIWPFKETIETTVNRHGDIIPLIENNILPKTLDSLVILSIITATAGFLFVFVLNRFAEKKLDD